MTERLISSIRIDGLFGLYTYRLPEKESFSNAGILYGDNGVGKSTVLRLVFHLLSAADNRGHRSALLKTEFRKLSVELSSRISLSVQRVKEKKDTLELRIQKSRKTLAKWTWTNSKPLPDRIRLLMSHEEFQFSGVDDLDEESLDHINYIRILRQVVPNIFLLNSDRRLYSDEIPNPSEEMELRRVMKLEDSKNIDDLVSKSHALALVQALSEVRKWFSEKAVKASNLGSSNVHTVYEDIFNHLLENNKQNKKIEKDTLLKRMSELESKTKEFSQYDLSSSLGMKNFRAALNKFDGQNFKSAAALLVPYISSLESRFAAINPIYLLVDKFSKMINSLLQDKHIIFRVGEGIKVINKLGIELEPKQLSSGEQQLLLLFCYVLMSGDKPTIFMIDEPEISLNIKWQRQLVQSLLDLKEGSKVQFIFATHSIELLSQYRDRVVELKTKQ